MANIAREGKKYYLLKNLFRRLSKRMQIMQSLHNLHFLLLDMVNTYCYNRYLYI